MKRQYKKVQRQEAQKQEALCESMELNDADVARVTGGMYLAPGKQPYITVTDDQIRNMSPSQRRVLYCK